MQKYAVIGGHVISRSDGDSHYIGVGELIRLYGIHPIQCYCFHDDFMYRQWKGRRDLIKLRPDPTGEYKIRGKKMAYKKEFNIDSAMLKEYSMSIDPTTLAKVKKDLLGAITMPKVEKDPPLRWP